MEASAKTQRELVEYLRATSARCRLHAEKASDPDAAQTLRQVADEMDAALTVLEDSKDDA